MNILQIGFYNGAVYGDDFPKMETIFRYSVRVPFPQYVDKNNKRHLRKAYPHALDFTERNR